VAASGKEAARGNGPRTARLAYRRLLVKRGVIAAMRRQLAAFPEDGTRPIRSLERGTMDGELAVERVLDERRAVYAVCVTRKARTPVW
jgi:hypothetical protein